MVVFRSDQCRRLRDAPARLVLSAQEHSSVYQAIYLRVRQGIYLRDLKIRVRGILEAFDSLRCGAKSLWTALPADNHVVDSELLLVPNANTGRHLRLAEFHSIVHGSIALSSNKSCPPAAEFFHSSRRMPTVKRAVDMVYLPLRT